LEITEESQYDIADDVSCRCEQAASYLLLFLFVFFFSRNNIVLLNASTSPKQGNISFVSSKRRRCTPQILKDEQPGQSAGGRKY
jgi:hypothetical protein